MSFNDSPALEAQPTTWRRSDDATYRDDPEYDKFTKQLSEQLFGLTAGISRLSNEVGLLGTRRETERVRERVQDLLHETSDGFKSVGEGIKKIQARQDLNPSQRYTQTKLSQEFGASLNEFQGLQRRALEKQRASQAAAKAALETQGEDQSIEPDSAQLQQEQRLAQQDDVDFQESLIIEREAEIRNIQSSVGELNELFRDVAAIVHEQGQVLDLVSDNVTRTAEDTRRADVELRAASRHQRSARGKACCLLLILVIVLLVVVLAVVLG
ncbi:SNARE domain protein [Piedraia hortae CBS 480.64]|uniref:SNARE domain protein n=1 Tax=Piedraia hortae CBS 480.64 TaxID=1314780 RepID=A0A6A7CBQ7_9PEZI|nr:SNARE domain protein [Piedraia hortae CBS 480.64]